MEQFETLRSGDFLTRQDNLLIFGKPGSGKTMLLSALGDQLVKQGRSVCFSTCQMLVQETVVLCAATKSIQGPGATSKQLPQGTFMKACINCAFSDYNPAGSGMFGCMACFRDNKEAYLSLKAKQDIFRIWDTLTEYVQETYVCPEFERRQPGTGYRG